MTELLHVPAVGAGDDTLVKTAEGQKSEGKTCKGSLLYVNFKKDPVLKDSYPRSLRHCLLPTEEGLGI